MKLQNFVVLFIIIVIPIMLVTAYYMSLQVTTVNMQTSYDSKILGASKEAIEAYEINTTEWNVAFNQHGDSQRRDVMAAVNTFTTSFANSLGISRSK